MSLRTDFTAGPGGVLLAAGWVQFKNQFQQKEVKKVLPLIQMKTETGLCIMLESTHAVAE